MFTFSSFLYKISSDVNVIGWTLVVDDTLFTCAKLAICVNSLNTPVKSIIGDKTIGDIYFLILHLNGV